MDEKEIITLWRKRCLKDKSTPICLIAVDKDGFPHVYTQHEQATLKKVFEHLSNTPTIDSKTHFDNQEN